MTEHGGPTRPQDRVIILAIVLTFGLAVLMLLQGYDPAVVTAVVTGTGFAAAELARRLRQGPPRPPGRSKLERSTQR